MQASLNKKFGGVSGIIHFLLNWAAIITLVMCFAIFTFYRGSSFLSQSNMINILRAMSITTVFGIGLTVTMAPDGFDMSACTLASCSAYIFVSAFLWFGLPLWLCIVITIAATMILYQITMFMILVCKVPDMLATCSLMFVYQGWAYGISAAAQFPPVCGCPEASAAERRPEQPSPTHSRLSAAGRGSL